MGLDTALTLIANRHRRKILVSLNERKPRERLSATEIAHFGEKEMTELRTTMKHIHLPKLRETNVVEVVDENRETFRVTRGEQFSDIRPLVTALEAFEDELPGTYP